MKRLLSLLFAAAVAGSLVAGCSKSSDSASSDSATAAATGPITDSGSDGMKETASTTTSTAGDAAHGKQIFSQNCSSCHGADGTQGGVGPSLKSEKSRKDLAKTIAWIKDPQPPMPKLYPSTLGEKDVADVAAYVQSL